MSLGNELKGEDVGKLRKDVIQKAWEYCWRGEIEIKSTEHGFGCFYCRTTSYDFYIKPLL